MWGDNIYTGLGRGIKTLPDGTRVGQTINVKRPKGIGICSDPAPTRKLDLEGIQRLAGKWMDGQPRWTAEEESLP